MMPAAKHGDPQMGVDIHLCVVPLSPSPVPLPTPHMSIVFDPFDYVPILGATITVCGMKRATAGTNATVVHIPPGFPFAPKMPEKDDELFMGSSTVVADGDPMSFIAVPVLSCQVAGMPSIPRLKKKGAPKAMLLPTTVNLAIPTNVTVGGPPTISLMGMAMKGAFAALGKFAKSGLFKRMRQKLFGHLNPGFLKCTILRAEPVNILTGEVSVEQEDFKLPGRIPIEWVRSYASSRSRKGCCGYGWETLADTRLEVDRSTGSVTMIHPSVGPLVFERLPIVEGETGAELELIDGARLSDHGDEFRVQTKEDRIYIFAKTLRHLNGHGTTEYPITRISDLCGNRLDFERQGETLSALQASGGRRLVFKTELGRITEVAMALPGTDEPHVFVRYEYDAAGDLVAVYDALDNPYTFAYDDHHMVRHTDRNGLSFYYEYEKPVSAAWRVLHAWGDGDLYNYRFEYIDPLNERRITNSLGHVSVVKLNEAGLPISEIDPLGGMTIYEYDEAGRTSAVVDQAGRRTAYQYDERGNLLKFTRPDGASIQSKFDRNNRAILVKDPNGCLWRQEWNERGLLTQQITPLGNVSRYEYDNRGQLIAFVNPRDARTELRFDGVGNLVEIINPIGNSTRLFYDALHNITSKIDPLHRSVTYRYDKKNRLTGITTFSTAIITYAYDAQDNLVLYTDENGAKTKLQYSGLGQIKRRITPDGHSVQYHYDTEERLIGVTNQRGERYELRRDALGRIVEEIDYWGQGRHYEYDPGGYLRRTTDPLGRQIKYATDPLGRITKKVLPDDFIEEFAYDGNGNLIGAKNPHIELTRLFDPEGRLLKEMQGDDFAIENKYDEAGNRIERKTSLGNTIRYKYDLLDQVSSIGINDAEPITITRDAAGQITQEALSPQLTRRLRHSPDGLLMEQSVTAGAMPLFAIQYDYDKAGNLTRRTDNQYGTEVYTYDPLGRIIEHIDPQGRLTRYLNDPAGDRLVARVSERNPAIGPVSDSGGQEWRREGEYRGIYYRFDRAGNLIERRDGKRDLRLLWDVNQRLIESDSKGVVTRYLYDSLGRRISKQSVDNESRFFWDGDAFVAEKGGDKSPPHNASIREYVYYPNSFEPLGQLVSKSGRLSLYHYHNDPNGCPTRLTDANGNLIWKANYSVWGGITQLNGNLHDNPLRMQGQYHDIETDLYYNRHRYYSAELGAFTTRDPIGFAGGDNHYQYATNTARWVDPLGLTCAPKPGTTRLWRAVEDAELKDVLRHGDYDIHPNSTFKRFAFDESSLDDFIAANPTRSYTKTFVDVPTEKLDEMYRHADPGGVGKSIGIDVYEHPEFYDWFDKVHIL
jgi:RHS repeat-associated protein